MLITLDGLKTALTAVLNTIGNKMEKVNPSAVGLFSLFKSDTDSGDYAHIVNNSETDGSDSNIHTLDWNGNAEFAGDVIANGCGCENPISLNNINYSLNGISCSVKSLQSKLQLEENLVETTSEEIQALFV